MLSSNLGQSRDVGSDKKGRDLVFFLNEFEAKFSVNGVFNEVQDGCCGMQDFSLMSCPTSYTFVLPSLRNFVYTNAV